MFASQAEDHPNERQNFVLVDSSVGFDRVLGFASLLTLGVGEKVLYQAFRRDHAIKGKDIMMKFEKDMYAYLLFERPKVTFGVTKT